VVLRFWGDLDYAEIGEALAISDALARWRVHQARKILLQKLSRAGLPPSNSSAAARSSAGGYAFTKDQDRRPSYFTVVSLPFPKLKAPLGFAQVKRRRLQVTRGAASRRRRQMLRIKPL